MLGCAEERRKILLLRMEEAKRACATVGKLSVSTMESILSS
jgi:hypothetical protein